MTEESQKLILSCRGPGHSLKVYTFIFQEGVEKFFRGKPSIESFQDFL